MIKINDDETTIEEIKAQLQEKRALPLGRTEFNEFCDRIWSGALLTSEPGQERLLRLSVSSLLADEIMHLPGGQTHESDLYFINRARKLAANQIAHTIKQEIHKEINSIIQDKKEKEDKLKLVHSDKPTPA